MAGEAEPQRGYYRRKAEIMREQAERAISAHLRAAYYAIARSWEAQAEGGFAEDVAE